ncbi:MAG: hypothetical protein KIH89_000020 [Candidatus Shapirobacteria bacterium]|nr:hypothetical protein [Candidatus Shapirobacteria bacterium]
MNKDFFKLPDNFFGLNISFLKLFIVPFFVLLVFVISFNLVIMPKFSELSSINGAIKSINQQINLTSQKITYLSSIDQEQIKNDAGFLESAVLQEKNAYFLVGVVRKVADDYGFTVNSFLIKSIEIKDEKGGTLKVSDRDVAVKLPIEVSLYGPDEKRVDLVSALEKTLPILFIENLDVSSVGGFSTLDMVISSYYVPETGEFSSGNLNLTDLIPTQQENDLLKTIGSFRRIETVSGEVGTSGAFVKYDRPNPFTL